MVMIDFLLNGPRACYCSYLLRLSSSNSSSSTLASSSGWSSTNFLRPLSRRKIERAGSEADVGIKNVQRHRDARQLIELDRKKVRHRGKSKEIRESQGNNQKETCLSLLK